jgi:CubicO group peptidase (beta-lactamase class C family)
MGFAFLTRCGARSMLVDRRGRRQRWFAAVLLASGTAWPAHAAPFPDEAIRAAMTEWQVPGLAVAAVHGDRPAEIHVYGSRDPASGAPVTPRTLFAVGSIAKSFTVVALSQLAEAGRFDWDAPVRTYLPGFRLYSERLTETVTGRDLVTHRTGIPRHDALWSLHAYDSDQLMARLRFLRPAAPLRAVYAYNNLMVAAAGRAVARISRSSWREVVRTRILDPLGMARTRLTRAGFLVASDRARPTFMGDDGRVATPVVDTDPIAPAAAIYSDAEEMGAYLRMLVNGGAVAGRRIVSRESVRAMRTAEIAMGREAVYPEVAPRAYGMGLEVTRYRGHVLADHPGVIDGYAAMLAILPDDRLGVVVLSNMSGTNPVPRAVAYAVLDAALGLPQLPWAERLKDRHAAWRAARTAAVAARAKHDAAARAARTPPPRPLEAYAGDYENPAYGRMVIRADGGGLAGALHAVRFALVHGTGDDWQVPETAWPLRAGLAMRFAFDGQAKAASLATPLADGPAYRLKAGDIVFRRANGP